MLRMSGQSTVVSGREAVATGASRLVALLVVVLGTLMLTVTASAKAEQTWDLTHDYGAHPESNPAPDQYGDTGVWSFMYGSADTPSSYALGSYISPAQTKASCGRTGFYVWDKAGALPEIAYNAGPMIKEGQDPCEPHAKLATETVSMAPEIPGSMSAVVGWKSPITGTVTVSGSVARIDSIVTGIGLGA
jgi:hypothetical protein